MHLDPKRSSTHIPRLDSLRAIAVILVLMFHFAPETAPWGFLGVDIFFTISGFLMTHLYLRLEETENRIGSALAFIKRRFWRIYPSLLITIFFSVLISYAIFSASHLTQNAWAGLYAIISISNLYFFSQSNYFDISSIYKPLLHTWSLGVEEQFYIIFALIIGLTNKRGFQITLLIMATLSLILWIVVVITIHIPTESNWSIHQFHEQPVSSVFFLIQYRAFQFAFGGLAASLFFLGHTPKWAEIPALLLILLAFTLTYSDSIEHLSALPISLGITLLILRSPMLDKISILPPIQYIARISFQLYLVHWPIIVFWHYTTLTPLTVYEIIVASFLCIVAAEILFRFTESMRIQ